MSKTTSTISKKHTGIINVLAEPSHHLLTNYYAEQVASGNIIASKKNILAAKRHMSDLEKQGTEEFPWVFDEDLGHRPIKFIEKYCKPSKGRFKRLILQPWQHFILGSLFGWVHKDTELRRFKEGLIFVARKQGKTTLISGVANYGVSKDGENGADIPLLANSMKQARLLFDESKAMIKASPLLRKHFRPLRDAIHYDKTFSKIEPQATDSEKLDGLNTHIGIFDEIHEYKDYKLINVIKNSRGSREQPLLIYITTAGKQLDGPLVNYYEQGSDTLNEVIQDDRTFYYIAELDDPKEFDQPDMWIKASPNIGVSVKLEDMIEEWDKAKKTAEERSDFITKRFNIFVNATKMPFIDYEVLKRNSKEMNISSIQGKVGVGGYDLSDTEDFTSACIEVPLIETGEVFVLSHSWIPRKKVLKENEKIPYQEWERMGLLTIVEGEYINEDHVFDWFVEQSKQFNIDLVTYDPAKAFRLNIALQEEGFETEKVRQGFMTLGPAMDDLKHLFIDGKVIFNNNPLMRWYINNVELVIDRNRNKMPTKANRYRKIDGFAALLNSHTQVMERLVTPAGNGDVGFVSLSDLRG